MRNTTGRYASLFLLLLAASASAAVNEPNGLQVPRDPSDPTRPEYNQNYRERSLRQFFQSENENIDWLQDALTTPAVFSPLCGFTAKFVLNEAGNKFGVGWYNVDPNATQPPATSEIYILIPANSPVGTTINSADIRNNANYRGGLIGFALVGGQTHYSEQRWNVVCTSNACQPPAPWITALIYKSSRIANAYYLAFEDGNVTSTSFNNDGDFNDDVFLLTGLACSGEGVPCSTGQQGVCSGGVTVCDTGGTLNCQPITGASAEACDGLDNDCDGTVDDGASCPNGFVCDRGRCVGPCTSGEFPCVGGLICDQGVCVEQGCVGVRCAAGQVCRQGQCRGGCEDVVCPLGQVCRVGRCTDPCQGVSCDSGRVCVQGVCITACDCQPCSAGLACSQSGLCVEPACVNQTCSPGTSCQGGVCRDNCSGANCPDGQICQSGQCVDYTPPPDMLVTDMSRPPSDMSVPRDGGRVSDGGIEVGGGDGGPGSVFATGGCGCHLGGRQHPGAGALAVFFLAAGLALAARRRRG